MSPALGSLLLLLAQAPATPEPTAGAATLLVLIERPGDKAFAELLTRATSAALSNAGLAYSPAPERPLSEIVFTLGCTDLDAACAASVGKSLNVATVVVTELVAHPAPAVIWSLIDVASARRVSTRALGVTRFDMVGAQQAATAIARDLGAPGTLRVHTQPPGATVRIDGQVVGETPLASAGLSEGSHRVSLGLPGGVELEQVVQAQRGEDLVVEVALAGDAAPGADSGVSASRLVGWSLVGASLVSAAAGGVLGGLALLARSRYDAEQVVDGISVRQVDRAEAKAIAREIEAEVVGAEMAFASSLALALGSAMVLGLTGE